MLTKPVNPRALPCVHRLLAYLHDVEGRAILSGQHTQSMAQEVLSMYLGMAITSTPLGFLRKVSHCLL